jgi:hypothetical protein
MFTSHPWLTMWTRLDSLTQLMFCMDAILFLPFPEGRYIPMANSSQILHRIRMIGLSTTLTGALVQSSFPQPCHRLNFRFVDRDMVIHYHWGHGMGHTYAFSANSDVADPPLNEIEEQHQTGSWG